MTSSRDALPLQDIKVLDFSFHLPGPLASLILAEAGAEVIKVERPETGDELRSIPPFVAGEGIGFAMLNRGKKSVSLDLKDPGSVSALAPLLRDADILIDQFRPGVMARLGLGYEAVRKINPGIIYCSITGYGQSGPNSMKPGHDLTYCAEAGLLSLTKDGEGSPAVPQVTIADIAGGSYPAVMNILLALRRKEKTGLGCHLDIAMSRNLFTLQYWAVGQTAVTGRSPEPSGSLLNGGSPRYAIYRTSDGRHLAAAPIEDRFWLRFCELIELPEKYRDDRQDAKATRAAIAAIIARNPADHWDSLLGTECCCAKVRDLDEALADEHFRSSGAFAAGLRIADGQTVTAATVPVDDALSRSRDALSAPQLGEHNALLGKRG